MNKIIGISGIGGAGKSTLTHRLGDAGKPFIEVWDVTQPTMTIYSPKIKNTAVTIVVFPGGGFHALAIDLEGTEICQWLTSKGITCALLKYRVPNSGPNWNMDLKRQVIPKDPTSYLLDV